MNPIVSYSEMLRQRNTQGLTVASCGVDSDGVLVWVRNWVGQLCDLHVLRSGDILCDLDSLHLEQTGG